MFAQFAHTSTSSYVSIYQIWQHTCNRVVHIHYSRILDSASDSNGGVSDSDFGSRVPISIHWPWMIIILNPIQTIQTLIMSPILQLVSDSGINLQLWHFDSHHQTPNWSSFMSLWHGNHFMLWLARVAERFLKQVAKTTGFISKY